MTIANITRPTCTENFTVLPNALFDFNRNFQSANLKPRDSAVLNYLLTKPSQWKLRAKDIATAVNICERTVYKALKKLQLLGFAYYTRESSGYTHWFISVAENPVNPVITPHSKKSEGKLPHGKIFPALPKPEKTVVNTEESLTNIEKTTTNVAEVVEIVEINIEQFNAQEKIIAKKSLSKISVTAQQIVLMVLKVALLKGNIKSPLAYLNALINKSIAGELDTTHIEKMQAAVNPVSRDDKIKQLFAKHGDTIQIELKEKGFIFVSGIGTIVTSDFEKLGLVARKGSLHSVL